MKGFYNIPLFFIGAISIVCAFSFNGYANNTGHLTGNQTAGTDTNIIIKINYPVLSAREGKGLNIPKPPEGHPRLFLTKRDLNALKEKIKLPIFKDCNEKILHSASFATNGYLKQNDAGTNFDISIRDAIEAKALLYLFSNDPTQGRAAVTAMLNFYATLHFNLSKQDGCREIGRAIVTGAIVYDWCYQILTSQEKQILVGRMETLATQLEIKWPKLVQGSIVGHGVEAQLSRDMLSCGVATYDEKPEIYNLAAGRIIAEFVPVRKFFYPAAYHHQGSAYGPYRFNWDMFATFIFDKMGYPEIFGADQAKAPYYFIYSRRPDGQLLRNGDDFNELFSPFGKYWNVGGSADALAGSYFDDPILLSESLKEGRPGKTADYLFDFLLYAASIKSNNNKALLPLTRYFKAPFGAMIARTGWEEGLSSAAVVAEMKVGVYNFANHQHLDAGTFQIYYKGPLTVQSGIYQGTDGGYGSDHFLNYSQRSIAHNTLLIYDPNEKFYWHNRPVMNDGGQQFPNHATEPENLESFLKNEYKTGEVLAHYYGPDPVKPAFTYLKGDLTAAYGDKVKSFKRSFVFLNLEGPQVHAALIVFDQVAVANKDFKNYWLLHCVEEPAVDGIQATIKRTEKGYNGKMVNTTLLPTKENLIINKVGGPLNEFRVFGNNFPQSPEDPKANSVDGAAWRIEVSPRIASVNNLFLNVMQVMDNKVDPLAFPIEKVETDLLTGTKIGDRIVLFSKTGELIKDSIPITISGNGLFRVLIVDAKEGNWKLMNLDGKKNTGTELKNDAQLLYFTVPAGHYIVFQKANVHE